MHQVAEEGSLASGFSHLGVPSACLVMPSSESILLIRWVIGRMHSPQVLHLTGAKSLLGSLSVRSLWQLPLICIWVSGSLVVVAEEKEVATHFSEKVRPLLKRYCSDCHSGDQAEGGVAFDRYVLNADVQKDFELWEKVIRLVRERQMPPEDADPIDLEKSQQLISGLEYELSQFDCSSQTSPGRVTLRRLNKAEYDNTIRDLTGLDLKLAREFPSDDVGNGFDNIADVLSLPPVLLEKYLQAAQRIATAIWEDEQVRKTVYPIESSSESVEDRVLAATQNVRSFAERAFRRPITDEEQQRLFAIMRSVWELDGSDAEIMKTVTAAILSNPNFLFRVEEDQPGDELTGIRQLNSYEIASRLSYFLWSSMPDERLFGLAAEDAFQNPEVIVGEARRMLADPKARALIDNFAGQWLQLRDVERLTPDPEMFPSFDQELRQSMRKETEEFFWRIVSEDRSVLEFLTADYTYVNERLAKHYGMNQVKGTEFQRVALNRGRRGILTHASILSLTSNPTRTSPVKRGKWILENILDEPPPDPPSDVPELEEGGETLGSLREQMEQHRANPSCASCHKTMDALGFGLENFDAIGAFRDQIGEVKIDASGQLPGNRDFEGAVELMQILTEDKKQAFCQCMTEKLLIYALGRGLASYDRCAVKDAVDALGTHDYRFSALVASIVTSDPFTMRELTRAK
ncbi:DUF1592 domain-containing protein [Rhodopirellula sp.]|nr:DUF1592 domain-containing protein [Rhodopirellula sp.]MDB4678832.1 DUF1592 domain-containing protein [Rhodopirellula sp.]